MIDIETGDVVLQKSLIHIGPALTRDAFLELPIGDEARVDVKNEPHCSFAVKAAPDELMGVDAQLTLYFYGQQLDAVDICATDDRFGTSWDDWSEEKEMERKRFHNRWLRKVTGRLSCQYAWGEIFSEYDPKSGCSTIVIRYSWKGKPWKR